MLWERKRERERERKIEKMRERKIEKMRERNKPSYLQSLTWMYLAAPVNVLPSLSIGNALSPPGNIFQFYKVFQSKCTLKNASGFAEHDINFLPLPD